MGDQVIIGIILVLVVMAVVRAVKHFGRGGCCGSGGNTIRDRKMLDAPKVGQKTMTIQGMHCENCEIRVQNALNRLEGVACKVSWKKKTAVVSYSTAVPEELLKETVQKLGYEVTDIR